MSITFRDGTADDVPQLCALYNHFIRETAITFDLDEQSLVKRQSWFDSFAHSSRHRLRVACSADGSCIGYACTQALRQKAAYDRSVETSVYLQPDWQGQGIGKALYKDLFICLADSDIHRYYAAITVPNAASIALHQAFDFVEVGRFTEVGFKFGKWWDVAWLERGP